MSRCALHFTCSEILVLNKGIDPYNPGGISVLGSSNGMEEFLLAVCGDLRTAPRAANRDVGSLSLLLVSPSVSVMTVHRTGFNGISVCFSGSERTSGWVGGTGALVEGG